MTELSYVNVIDKESYEKKLKGFPKKQAMFTKQKELLRNLGLYQRKKEGIDYYNLYINSLADKEVSVIKTYFMAYSEIEYRIEELLLHEKLIPEEESRRNHTLDITRNAKIKSLKGALTGRLLEDEDYIVGEQGLSKVWLDRIDLLDDMKGIPLTDIEELDIYVLLDSFLFCLDVMIYTRDTNWYPQRKRTIEYLKGLQ